MSKGRVGDIEKTMASAGAAGAGRHEIDRRDSSGLEFLATVVKWPAQALTGTAPSIRRLAKGRSKASNACAMNNTKN